MSATGCWTETCRHGRQKNATHTHFAHSAVQKWIASIGKNMVNGDLNKEEGRGALVWWTETFR